MSEPITVAIHVTINGKLGAPLAVLTLDDPRTAGWEMSTALRKIADEMDFQHLAAGVVQGMVKQQLAAELLTALEVAELTLPDD